MRQNRARSRRPLHVGRRKKDYRTDEGRGQFWRSTIDTDTVCASPESAKPKRKSSELVFLRLSRRCTKSEEDDPEGPPPLSDPGAIREMLVVLEVSYGRKCTEYEASSPGRFPPEKKRPQEGWQYLQSPVREASARGCQRHTPEASTEKKPRYVFNCWRSRPALSNAASDDAPRERTTHAKGVRLLDRRFGCTVRQLGGGCLQPSSARENVAPDEAVRPPKITLDAGAGKAWKKRTQLKVDAELQVMSGMSKNYLELGHTTRRWQQHVIGSPRRCLRSCPDIPLEAAEGQS